MSASVFTVTRNLRAIHCRGSNEPRQKTASSSFVSFLFPLFFVFFSCFLVLILNRAAVLLDEAHMSRSAMWDTISTMDAVKFTSLPTCFKSTYLLLISHEKNSLCVIISKGSPMQKMDYKSTLSCTRNLCNKYLQFLTLITAIKI